VPLCPPQIPHGPTRDRTLTSAVRDRRLTAWPIARPWVVLKNRILRTFTILLITWRRLGLLSHQCETVKANNMRDIMDTAFWLENVEGRDHLGSEGEDIRWREKLKYRADSMLKQHVINAYAWVGVQLHVFLTLQIPVYLDELISFTNRGSVGPKTCMELFLEIQSTFAIRRLALRFFAIATRRY
jgi:hypothetical protein